MPQSLTNIFQIILVQQIAFIQHEQDRYRATGKIKYAEKITELMNGLALLPDTIDAMNNLGILSIDVESIQVFMDKIKKNEEIEPDEEEAEDTEEIEITNLEN